MKTITFLLLLNVLLCRSQCLIKNGGFDSTYQKKHERNLRFPADWKLGCKYCHSYDDKHPYVIYGKTQYIRDKLKYTHENRHDIFTFDFFIDILGRSSNGYISTLLTQSLVADSVYEISVDVYSYFPENVIQIKYFPVYLGCDEKGKPQVKKMVCYDLYSEDKKILKNGAWHTVTKRFKASGYEKMLIISAQVDYKNMLVINNQKKATEFNTKGGFDYLIDNVCIKKISAW